MVFDNILNSVCGKDDGLTLHVTITYLGPSSWFALGL